MTATVPADVVANYCPPAGAFDEMVDAEGRVRDHWAPVGQVLDGLGMAELERRRVEAARLLDDDGVTYNVYGDHSAPPRWVLDPVPVLVTSEEWARIESAVIQRAELLNWILADLYGPRQALRRGWLPPELVFDHPGFLRSCDGIALPGDHQLFTAAVDLARDADGQSWVLADRTQAPSGAGYALENRVVMSRIFPSLYRDAQVHRLAPFVRALRGGLQAVAAKGVDDPRIVVLTPGAQSETAFEHAFLAAHLGYSLVEGADLVMQSGRVWMRSLGRLQPVDVILRRVDAWFCDPLELRPDSYLGVPGLVEACRRGVVSVVNTIGSGVLENPGLVAFLPLLAEKVLGEQLELPSVPTWWCGEPIGLSHVLANLDRLVIKPTARGIGLGPVPEVPGHAAGAADAAGAAGAANGTSPADGSNDTRDAKDARDAEGAKGAKGAKDASRAEGANGAGPANRARPAPGGGPGARLGWQLSKAELDDLRRQIEARPHQWVGQEQLSLSSVPTLGQHGLLAQRSMLRAFAVARGDSYLVMPGGLTRVARRDGAAISNQAGAVSKDTWVLASEPEQMAGVWLSTGPPVPAVEPETSISTRSAENLVWLGRYAERAESVLRILRVVHDRRNDFADGSNPAGSACVAVLLAALTEVTATYPGFAGVGGEDRIAEPGAELQSLAMSAQRPGTLAFAVRHLVDAAYAARDQLSMDTWLVISSLQRDLLEVPTLERVTLQRVLASLLALAGLGAESMVRDPGWRFMDAGRRIERGAQSAALLRATVTTERDAATDSLILESFLIASESIITYRRRYRSHAQLETLLDLMLLDPENPRSLRYQLDRLLEDLRALPDHPGQGRVSEAEKLVLEAWATLLVADTAQLARSSPSPGAALRSGLDAFLLRIEQRLYAAADALAAEHFTPVLPQRSLATPADPPGRPSVAPGIAVKYRVAHTTAYHYEDEVSTSYGQIHLVPRDLPGQRCQKSEVVIEPVPDDYRERNDFFGNRVAYFEIRTSHRDLSVRTISWIEIAEGVRGSAVAAIEAADVPWESARLAAIATLDLVDLDGREFLLDSPLVQASPELAAYGRLSFTEGRPVIEALADIASRVHADFEFRPGATNVTTTAGEVLVKRKGVCQDFAHLVIGCLRSLGLAARYVSGYLETDPPPDRPRLEGADVSHAWASVLVPGMGWIDVDPTNRQLVTDRYVVTAWGRDYSDVPPLMGVIFTEGTEHELEVLVDVVRQ